MRCNREISRRTVLRGCGLGVALPWLESLQAASQTRPPAGHSGARRMALIFAPNGVIMPDWTPEKTGTDYALSKSLQPLEFVRDEVCVLSGLGQDNGRAKGDGAGDHARSAASYLTGSHPYKTSGADIRNGISVDQVAATQIGQATRLPSLELGMERGRNAGSCDSGYSCAYSSNISWRSETTPVAKEIQPRAVFERMFGDGTEPRERQLERRATRRSVLDFVTEDARRLLHQVSVGDRRKLDEYFESVRDVERRLDSAEPLPEVPSDAVAVPLDGPADLGQRIRLMYDLIVLAFRTDATRVVTFMVGNAGSNQSYPMVGVNAGHHSLSHHRNDDQKIQQLQKIDQYLVEQFAYFVRRLREVPEGESTLLDQSMVMYGSGLGDGNRHDHVALPVLLAGRGGGTLKTGMHRRYERETPLNNLFMSMLDRMGCDITSIGDSTGRLADLDV